MVENVLGVEVRRNLSMTISYQSLREAVTQHAMFNSSVKSAIAPKEVL